MPSIFEGLAGKAGDALKSILGFDANSGGGIYFKSDSTAHNLFDGNKPHFSYNVPYLESEFFAHLTINGNARDYFKQFFSGYDYNYEINTVIKSVQPPAIDIDTVKLNSYNRQRISQTRANIGSTKIVFHDSVDGKMSKLWGAIYSYYFSEANTSSNLKPGIDGKSLAVVNDKLAATTFASNGEFGYNLDNIRQFGEKELFSSLSIAKVHRGKVSITELILPRIVSCDVSTLDYSSSETTEYVFTIECEYVQYHEARLEAYTEISQFFDGTLSDPFEPQGFANISTANVGKVDPSLIQGGGFGGALANVESPLDALKLAKKTGQNVLGSYSRASAMFNQIQMDITGDDEPIVEAPSVREFSAIVNNVPDSYKDIRRSVRNYRHG